MATRGACQNTKARADQYHKYLLTDFKVYANILALLTSSPTLNSLQLPGFSTPSYPSYSLAVLTNIYLPTQLPCSLILPYYALVSVSCYLTIFTILSHFPSPGPCPVCRPCPVYVFLCPGLSRCLWLFSVIYLQQKP